MSSQQPSLIVPVESQVRELDAKLLLAAVAAERGFSVVFGSRAYVHHAMAAVSEGRLRRQEHAPCERSHVRHHLGSRP